MTRTRAWILAAVAAAVVAAVAITAVVVGVIPKPPATVTSSPAQAGSDASALLRSPIDPTSGRRSVWRSSPPADGSWVQVTWDAPRSVDHIALLAARTGGVPRAAAVRFGDGAAIHVAPDSDGLASVDFPGRRASTVRIQLIADPDTDSVALSALRVDDSGSPSSSDQVATTTASSSGDGHPASALTDGDIAAGRAGLEWRAATGDPRPAVRMSWAEPVEVSSVQILGPAERVTDPSQTAAAQLRGRLEFDDGSEVDVPAIEGGDGAPTTVAFMPRMVSSMRLVLSARARDAPIALREFRAYASGTTPPVWPHDGGVVTRAAAAGSCSDPGDGAASTSDGEPVLLCPGMGSTVGDSFTLAVRSAPASALSVRWNDGAEERELVGGSTGDDGIARLRVPTANLPRGPLALTVVDGADASGDPSDLLHVQVVHRSGQRPSGGGSAPRGMTLQWDDEFDEPLSVSTLGRDATYGARKPEYFGGSEFGDASFADPSGKARTVSTDDGFLRLRATRVDDDSSDHDYLGGMLSSARVGGAGLSAQYGYFEARMLGAPDPGSWPAFWMLDAASAADDIPRSLEVDAVELYGHDLRESCHSTHTYLDRDNAGGDTKCLTDDAVDDWSAGWHTYGARVEPGSVTFFIDGHRVAQTSDVRDESRPLYFMLNLALGGGWPVDLSRTGGTTDLYVDWVRVYT